MPSSDFYFRHFVIRQDKCAMKIGTDSILLGAYARPGNARLVLDIGTGTGVLALMLAQQTGDSTHIDALEIDAAAFSQACENIRNSAWHYRLMAYHCSLQEFRTKAVGLYNFIISNPPYFADNTQITRPGRKMARTTGSLPYDDLCFHVARLLKDDGSFMLILPCSQSFGFVDAARQHGLFLYEALQIRSYPDTPVVREILTFGFEKKQPEIKSLYIYDSPGQYSSAYKQLTADYYAHQF